MTYNLWVKEWVLDAESGNYRSKTIATGTLTGTATGYASRYWWAGGQAEGNGLAKVSALTISDPAKAPDWLPNLQVRIEIKPTDVRSEYRTVTSVSSGEPVPEPGSVLVFLAATGAGVVIHRRRRRRA